MARKNKDAAENSRAVFGGNSQASEHLKSFVERIERLEGEKAELTGDIKDVFAELKGHGFDVKAVRSILKIRKKDHAERQEEEMILETYLQALGMI